MIYYRDPRASELTAAGLDSNDFFRGPASEKQKQDIFDKLHTTYNEVVEPLRGMGFSFWIGRSYSEGAANHGSGYALDLVPHGKSLNEAYSLADAAAALEKCEQVWIEASDDSGNFHVHIKYDSSGKNSSPMLKTIMTREGGSGEDGLVHKTESVVDAQYKVSS